MAAFETFDVYVSSLENSCLRAVAEHVKEHQESLHLLPNEVKDKLVKLFSKRGLLNDEILAKVYERGSNLQAVSSKKKSLRQLFDQKYNGHNHR
jgi:hypothetical protein